MENLNVNQPNDLANLKKQFSDYQKKQSQKKRKPKLYTAFSYQEVEIRNQKHQNILLKNVRKEEKI
jgi:hypothetical protein